LLLGEDEGEDDAWEGGWVEVKLETCAVCDGGVDLGAFCGAELIVLLVICLCQRDLGWYTCAARLSAEKPLPRRGTGRIISPLSGVVDLLRAGNKTATSFPVLCASSRAIASRNISSGLDEGDGPGILGIWAVILAVGDGPIDLMRLQESRSLQQCCRCLLEFQLKRRAKVST